MAVHPSSRTYIVAGVTLIILSIASSFSHKAEAFSLPYTARVNNVKINPILSHSKNWNAFHSSVIPNQRIQMSADSNNEQDFGEIWSPQLRRVMGTLATVGMFETAYLTYLKWTSSDPLFCTLQGSCADVLNGPYASVGDMPLSAFGFAAYASVAILSLLPLLSNGNKSMITDDDSSNRLALVFVTTSMATFSSFLMSLLFSILHESCPYCNLSAALSITLSLIVWFGGAVEQKNTNKPIAQTGISSAVLTTLASVAFYVSIDAVSAQSASAVTDPNMPPGGYPAPTITTKSSPESLKLAKQLNSLHAKMYGAYWCSHCYDQKEAFGKESMEFIPYVECSKEGKNSQTQLCKEKEVPGYPTWIIQDKLYPGEQSLEELEEIVKSVSIAK